jgi:hypothetical protein
MKQRFLVLPLFAALAACSNQTPAQNLPPLDYSYLPPITFKVASMTVANNYVPTPGQATLIDEAPQPPALVLQNMLSHRLVASGAPGQGTATIETASLDQVGSNLTGTLTVDVNLSSADGRSTGYTEATVTATQTAPDPDAAQSDVQAALYNLTKRLMDSMNVQLQYQIQHNLGPWLVWSNTPAYAAPSAGGAGPALGGGIQATPLTAPAAPTTPLPAGTGNLSPAVPQYLPGAGPAALTPPATP